MHNNDKVTKENDQTCRV